MKDRFEVTVFLIILILVLVAFLILKHIEWFWHHYYCHFSLLLLRLYIFPLIIYFCCCILFFQLMSSALGYSFITAWPTKLTHSLKFVMPLFFFFLETGIFHFLSMPNAKVFGREANNLIYLFLDSVAVVPPPNYCFTWITEFASFMHVCITKHICYFNMKATLYWVVEKVSSAY